ncbi:hypothetical protein ACFQLX_13865 [Streptomyces polyrhachis]|uniref:Helix-turn-helix domain-containing protein n=1 Tax=Streptomyces polyrhachis TaxID=1282885 RepID=A0ABW2GET2_9ACTN
MAADAFEAHFTRISNALFRDPRLSFKAKGIFGLISTHRDGHEVSVEALAECAPDGVKAVRSGLGELESLGYLQRRQGRREGQFTPVEYVITDMPHGLTITIPGPRESSRNPSSPPDAPNRHAAERHAVERDAVERHAADGPYKKTNSFREKTKGEKTSSSSGIAAESPPPAGVEAAAPPDDGDGEAEARPDVEQVCTALADAVEANGSLRPSVTGRWRTEARLMLDKDHRTLSQVLTAISWCQNDPFWRSNILSIPKLREKYDQLRLAALRQQQAPPGLGGGIRQPAPGRLLPGTDTTVAGWLDIAAKYAHAAEASR